MAPAEGPPQRPLPPVRIAGTGVENVETRADASEQFHWCEQVCPRRSKFDRKRQPVEPATEFANSARGTGVERKLRFNGSRAVDEQAKRRELEQAMFVESELVNAFLGSCATAQRWCL